MDNLPDEVLNSMARSLLKDPHFDVMKAMSDGMPPRLFDAIQKYLPNGWAFESAR